MVSGLDYDCKGYARVAEYSYRETRSEMGVHEEGKVETVTLF